MKEWAIIYGVCFAVLLDIPWLFKFLDWYFTWVRHI